ncbi:unnamed protein product [Urochloa humidicola]
MEFGSGCGGGLRRLRQTESAEMRWVVPGDACEEDEIESSDDSGADTSAAGSGSCGSGVSDDDEDDYEEDEMLSVPRTGSHTNSFDVEARRLMCQVHRFLRANSNCFSVFSACEVFVVLASRVRLCPHGTPPAHQL